MVTLKVWYAPSIHPLTDFEDDMGVSQNSARVLAFLNVVGMLTFAR